jgi:hypothetical protein
LVKPLSLLIAALLLACAGAGAGCNDDGDALTLEEYYERVAELDDEATAELDRTSGLLDELDEQQFDEARDLLRQQLAAFEGFADGLADLDPPSEVEDAHGEATEGLAEFTEAYGEALDELEGIDSIEEAAGVFEDLDRGGAERAGDACRSLEETAAANDIDVDLSCGDEE